MTVEDKILEFRKEFEELGMINSHLIDFNLWGDRAYSLKSLACQINEGNISGIREELPNIQYQFNLWMRYYRFVVKHIEIKFNTVGSVGLSDTSLPQIVGGKAIVVIPSAWYGITVKDMPPKLLWASRLINHAEVRCLKHPRFRKV